MQSSPRQLRIERAVDLINRGYRNALTLDELAAAACYSSCHFVCAFEAEVGEAPFETLRKRRLYSCAYRLLAEPGLAIGTLAAESGFCYATSLAKGFRRHFGMSASDWRQGGWNDWAGRARAAMAPNPELLADGTAPDPARLRLVRQPSMRVIYRRFRGVWGAHLIAAAQAALDSARYPVAGFYGARQDLLHLRGGHEACYDLCIPLAAGAALPRHYAIGELPGGLYAAYDLLPGEPYRSWRSLFGLWPPNRRFVPDPARPMLEAYPDRSHPLVCRTLYLPLVTRQR
ncbi:AraC family transcriptional regulator [Chitiniphilus purpureus]|uniref:AraC family transcriptional regulator n=1 Tax=Chitiniphilus purpureus TaxID=2981137 RepID=A0ABY6DKV4_9NEIS|nr:AraC family transcriptional regulator [Chitiniphilus sp. CD1]UXY14985.1 AraC family transcriptional regulator [Chitiniphilus sp. CD1]